MQKVGNVGLGFSDDALSSHQSSYATKFLWTSPFLKALLIVVSVALRKFHF